MQSFEKQIRIKILFYAKALSIACKQTIEILFRIKAFYISLEATIIVNKELNKGKVGDKKSSDTVVQKKKEQERETYVTLTNGGNDN